MTHRYKAGALRIDNDATSAWSYETCIMTTKQDGTRVYNFTSYSPTTTKHMSEVLRVTNPRPGVDVFVKDMPRGLSPVGLINASLDQPAKPLTDPIGKCR